MPSSVIAAEVIIPPARCRSSTPIQTGAQPRQVQMLAVPAPPEAGAPARARSHRGSIQPEGMLHRTGEEGASVQVIPHAHRRLSPERFGSIGNRATRRGEMAGTPSSQARTDGQLSSGFALSR